MKKALFLLMLSMAVCFSGCSDGSSSSNADSSTASTAQSGEATTPDISEPVLWSSGEYGEIYLTEIEDDALVFNFKNTSDQDLTFYSNDVTVNGEIYTDDIPYVDELDQGLWTDVLSNDEAKARLYFSGIGDMDLESVSAHLVVCDGDGYNLTIEKTNTLIFENGEVTTSEDAAEPDTSAMTKIFSNDYFDMYYIGVEEDSLSFLIHNNTDKELSFNNDDITLNGEIYNYEDIPYEDGLPTSGMTVYADANDWVKGFFYFAGVDEMDLESMSMHVMYSEHPDGTVIDTAKTDELTF